MNFANVTSTFKDLLSWLKEIDILSLKEMRNTDWFKLGKDI
jgi:hypothetical protein